MDPAWNSWAGGPPAAWIQAMLDPSMTATPSTFPGVRSNAVTDLPGEYAEAGMVSSVPVFPVAGSGMVTGLDRPGGRDR
jgi:hypothetical protein